jgi:hypothetical protein
MSRNIIAAIFAGAATAWHVVQDAIEADFAKVRSVLPSSALGDFDAAKTELKQAASDALSAAAGAAMVYAPTVVNVVEKTLDDALVSLTGGVAAPLTPLLNQGIDDVAAHAVAAIRAWQLKQKAGAASLAQNTAPTDLSKGTAASFLAGSGQVAAGG